MVACLRNLSPETDAGFQVILDYAVEGSASEERFQHNAKQVEMCIETCALEDGVSFAVVKPSALGCAEAMRKSQSQQDLSDREVQGLRSFLARVDGLCQKAQKMGVSLMVDAEESAFQHYVDDLLRRMMKSYNRQRPVVYATLQCYRKDALTRLENWLAEAGHEGFFLGIKMVRGAYMEKERRRAKRLGLPDPIHSTKQACDQAYDQAVAKCIEHIERVSVCVATHNERSCELAAELMERKPLVRAHPGICFSQLYGMAEALSHALKEQGYRVSKYVPYGPIEQVLPYLYRRMRENASVRREPHREWQLIRQEQQRRRLEKASA